MAIEWATVIVYCMGCEKSWTTLIPPGWDGSLISCWSCGEFACEIAEGG